MAALVLALAITAGTTVACSTASGTVTAASGGRVIQVVAAENFWGGIASQIGGTHVRVTSIITTPNPAPPSYEPPVTAAKAIAGAQLVIETGIGYDPWAASLLAADRGSQ